MGKTNPSHTSQTFETWTFLPGPALPDQPAPAQPDESVFREWEALLNSLLDLLVPHPVIYRAALHLLSGRREPLTPLPT